MDLNLRKVTSNKDIALFVKYKVLLIKYHQQYANALGLVDKIVEKYNEKDAKKHIGENNFFQYIIEFENNDAGILEYSIKTSDIDNKSILYIKNVFIDSKYRGFGIGKEVLLKIRNETDFRIELECWYGMPANELYKKFRNEGIKDKIYLEKIVLHKFQFFPIKKKQSEKVKT